MFVTVWMAVSNRWKTYLRIFMYMFLTWHNNQFANWSLGGISQTHWSFCQISPFWLRFTKQHDQFDCQQLNTTTNHIHPNSFTPELVTWTCMLWDTTVKKKSEILKCHQYLGFLFFFLWIYMWRRQYIIIYIHIHNRV